jgi:hypothetical protein
MFHHLEQTLLHYVRTRFTDQLVMAAEDKLEIIWSNTGVEVVCVLCWCSNPLAELLVVSDTRTCSDYSDLLALV